MILATLRAVGLGRPYPPPPEPLRRRPRAWAGGCNGRQRPSLGAGCEPLPDVGTKRLLRLLVFERLDAALTEHVDPLLGELLRDRRVGDLASHDRGGAGRDNTAARALANAE